MSRKYFQKENGIFVLSKPDVDNLACKTLRKYQPSALVSPKPLDLNELAVGGLNLNVESRYFIGDSRILGATVFAGLPIECANSEGVVDKEVFEPGTIVLSLDLEGEKQHGRKRFTYAHEISHWLLHQPFHNRMEKRDEFSTASRCVACKAAVIGGISFRLETDYDWEEWQANVMAAALLMPKATFDMAMGDALNMPTSRNKYCVAGENLGMVVKRLSEIYAVSLTAAERRIRELGYVRNPDVYCEEDA